MAMVRIIRRWEKYFWRIRRGGQIANRVSEAIEMVTGSISGLYWALFCRMGLSSVVMGSIFKTELPK